ncbi:molybdenum cofactor biosynthesis protein MoaE [Bradyrhizobium sp. I71]|uniref:molybdenum cofactor biosynthesis protein MoaE n=1 Tax=Bradyrhizobium sp. I71 TaxID=2590772 RepID=UPI001EF8986B|nr:molybdenum cofactor biosynthesis protein MoaE [Bradyrhizobium sp. I71]ULK98528.1 molybdenum cofactor biosynthesis protein MoaE [Bradyrhizobium sp. I71]
MIQTEDFDVGAEIGAICSVVEDAGAVASFVGLCRGEGGTLDGVYLESYPAMAYLEFDSIINAADERWSLGAVTIIHRYGRVLAGERIVLVAVAARHRKEAFAAAEFIMDFLKHDAPFWKRELRADGDSGAAGWVAAKASDASAAARWGVARKER